jgi:hypothetical protein
MPSTLAPSRPLCWPLRAHADDVEVQNYGCRALGLIPMGHNAAIRARASSLMCDAVTTVVAALNAHGADDCVSQYACGALWHLIDTEALRIEAAKIGAVTAVIAALRTHTADARMQNVACGAMRTLCYANADNAVQASRAGALQTIVAVLRAFSADVLVQSAACNALASILDAEPRLQAAAGAAGAVEAIAAAMRMPAAGTELPKISSSALFAMVRGGHRGNAERACAAGGVLDVLAATMDASDAHEDTETEVSVYDYSLRVLDALVYGYDDAARLAIHAGVLDIVAREGTQRIDPSAREVHAGVVPQLEAAARRHDTAVCTHDGCKRCAAARGCGRMCALPGCGARKRDDGSGKRLLRCGACEVVAFCGPAHQRADWGRHKLQCAALSAAAGAAAGSAD